MPGIRVEIENTSLYPEPWREVCDAFFDLLVDYTPVDTGHCRDNWESEWTEESFVAWNDVHYASYLDEGWSKQAPNGMIGPALNKLESLIDKFT